jgi:phosphoglycolate phosphatase
VRYRLLIFDFDGTLADSFPMFLEHMRLTVAHFKLRPVDEQSLDMLRGCGAREIMEYLGLPAWKVPLVARYMRRLMAADAGRTRLFPPVSDLLKNLTASGCVLAIVSSNSETNIRTILGPENSGRIGMYACGASLFGKASKFRRVLKHTGIPAAETLAVGDEIRDLEAAREAGIDFGAVQWGYTKIEAFHPYSPARVFHRPEELAELGAPRPAL